MAKCNFDCFNCVHNDCIVPDEECKDKESIEIEFHALCENLPGYEATEKKKRRIYNKQYRRTHSDEIRAYKKAYKDGTLIRKRSHKKAVIQMTCDGSRVARYESTMEAARILEKKWRMIGKACRGDNERGRKHGAYGFDWFYEEDLR